jgi:hypothetical protein
MLEIQWQRNRNRISGKVLAVFSGRDGKGALYPAVEGEH